MAYKYRESTTSKREASKARKNYQLAGNKVATRKVGGQTFIFTSRRRK